MKKFMREMRKYFSLSSYGEKWEAWRGQDKRTSGFLWVLMTPTLSTHQFCKLSLFFPSIFWPRYTACKILVPQPGIELVSSAIEVQSPNHWTTREVPENSQTLRAYISILHPALAPGSLGTSVPDIHEKVYHGNKWKLSLEIGPQNWSKSSKTPLHQDA